MFFKFKTRNVRISFLNKTTWGELSPFYASECAASGTLVSTFSSLFGSTNTFYLDCKTVSIFAYSSTREQSNKRSGTKPKTESETGKRRLTRPTGLWGSRASRVRLLRHALPISLLILRKKPTVLRFFLSRLTRPTGLWGSRAARVRLLRHALPISLLILRKKTTVLQSTFYPPPSDG